MSNKVEQYTTKIKNAQKELDELPNTTRTKAQYANLINKIEERQDLENVKIKINDIETDMLSVFKIAIEAIETPKEVKDKRKELNHTIKVYQKKILIELGAIPAETEEEKEEV